MFNFFKKNKSNDLDVKNIGSLIGKIDLIDIREPYEYNNGHLPTAKNIPMENILKNPETYLNKEKEYHIICQSGARSSRTCQALKDKGYNVINVIGGTSGYSGKLDK